MHLLYLDDAGSAANSNEEYLVLGGVSVYEAQIDWITQELDRIAQGIAPSDPKNLEFHASEIFSRRTPPWDRMSREDAQGTIKAVLRVMANSYESARTFACAVHKPSFRGRDPMELAFEDICSRFDMFLSRLRAAGDRQRGMLLLDDSTHETTLQRLSREFRQIGTRWGGIHNLADIPFFANSRASRLIQLADHVAYAVFRRYNAGDTQYFDIIAPRFDSADGIVHGLSHLHHTNPNCMCPACLSRRASVRT